MRISVKSIFIHLLLSVSFLMIPYIFIAGELFRFPDLLHSPHDRFTVFVYILMLGFFYINYYYLLPALYMKKQVSRYYAIVTGILVVLILFYYWVDFTPPRFFRPPPPPRFHDMLQRPLPPHPPHMHKPGAMSQLSQLLFLYIIGILVSLSARISRNLKNIELERNKTALAYLKSQINPHFLFNTLNSIYGLAVKEKADKTAGGMLKLSGILRYVLTETQSDFVSLSKEIDYISNYIELQRLRIDTRTNFNFQVKGETDKQMIAPMLLIPFIENAFKYGINPGIEAHIDIAIIVEGETLELHVFNKKIAERKDNSRPDQTMIGIENTKNRLALLYPERHQLDINEDFIDYRVMLRLNLAAPPENSPPIEES